MIIVYSLTHYSYHTSGRYSVLWLKLVTHLHLQWTQPPDVAVIFCIELDRYNFSTKKQRLLTVVFSFVESQVVEHLFLSR